MIIYHYHWKVDNISQTTSKRHSKMVLVIIFDIIIFLCRYVSNGFRLGFHAQSRLCRGDFLMFLSRLVVSGSTGSSRLCIVVVLRSPIMMCLPWEFWLVVNLDPGDHFTNNFSITIQMWWKFHFCSHPNTNKVIATKFGTWHDSWAVVACAKFGCDMITSNQIRAK